MLFDRMICFIGPSVILAGFLSGCEAVSPPPQSPAQSELSETIYERVMANSPGYTAIQTTKSLFACVVWPDGNGQKFEVRGYGGAYEAAYTDARIPTGKIYNGARTRCLVHEVSKSCKCTELDRDGRNVLIVPD